MKKIIILSVLVLSLILIGCNKKENTNINVTPNTTNNTSNSSKAISDEELIGTYSWTSGSENDEESNSKVELILKDDGKAEYNTKEENTLGYFQRRDNSIVYVREYHNPGDSEALLDDFKITDNVNLTEVFDIINSNTLKGVYNSEEITLKK